VVRAGPHLVCYHIWSCPLGFKLACVLSTGASQKNQTSYIKFSQFYLQISPCPCLFLIFLQVCDSLKLSDSSRFFSSASFGYATVSVAVLKIWCFISSGSTASVWCEVCCSAHCGVVAPYDYWHDLRPFTFLFTLEYFLDCFKD
jgi:hypothetical protein